MTDGAKKGNEWVTDRQAGRTGWFVNAGERQMHTCSPAYLLQGSSHHVYQILSKEIKVGIKRAIHTYLYFKF